MNTTISNQNGEQNKNIPRRAPAPTRAPTPVQAPAPKSAPAPMAAPAVGKPAKATKDASLAKIGIAVAAFGVTIGGWAIASNQMVPATTSATVVSDVAQTNPSTTSTLRQVTLSQVSNTQVRSVATTRSSQ